MPLSAALVVKNFSNASNPPAEAPMPTMGKLCSELVEGVLCSLYWTDFSFAREADGDFLVTLERRGLLGA